jgi:hypothetical protein
VGFHEIPHAEKGLSRFASCCDSLSYVQHATGRGEIPCVRIGKGDPRYRVMDLIEWQNARREA